MSDFTKSKDSVLDVIGENVREKIRTKTKIVLPKLTQQTLVTKLTKKHFKEKAKTRFLSIKKEIQLESFLKKNVQISGGQIPIEVPVEKRSLRTKVESIASRIKTNIFRPQKIVEQTATDVPHSNLKEKIVEKFEKFDQKLGSILSLVAYHLKIFQNDPFLYTWNYPHIIAVAYFSGLLIAGFLTSYSSKDSQQTVIKKKEESFEQNLTGTEIMPNLTVAEIVSNLTSTEIMPNVTGTEIVSHQVDLFPFKKLDPVIGENVRADVTPIIRRASSSSSFLVKAQPSSSFLVKPEKIVRKLHMGGFEIGWPGQQPTSQVIPETCASSHDQCDKRVAECERSSLKLERSQNELCDEKIKTASATAKSATDSIVKGEMQEQCRQRIAESSVLHCKESVKTIENLQITLNGKSCSANPQACLEDIRKQVNSSVPNVENLLPLTFWEKYVKAWF